MLNSRFVRNPTGSVRLVLPSSHTATSSVWCARAVSKGVSLTARHASQNPEGSAGR